MEAKMASNRLKISIFLINGSSFDDEKPIKITFISAKEVFKNLTKFWSFLNHILYDWSPIISHLVVIEKTSKFSNSAISYENA